MERYDGQDEGETTEEGELEHQESNLYVHVHMHMHVRRSGWKASLSIRSAACENGRSVSSIGDEGEGQFQAEPVSKRVGR